MAHTLTHRLENINLQQLIQVQTSNPTWGYVLDMNKVSPLGRSRLGLVSDTWTECEAVCKNTFERPARNCVIPSSNRFYISGLSKYTGLFSRFFSYASSSGEPMCSARVGSAHPSGYRSGFDFAWMALQFPEEGLFTCLVMDLWIICQHGHQCCPE